MFCSVDELLHHVADVGYGEQNSAGFMECAPDCRNGVTDGSKSQKKQQHTPQPTPTFLQLLCFTLVKADFSCLFRCTKLLFMSEGMFMFPSVRLALKGLLELLWAKQNELQLLNRKGFYALPLKSCFWFVFELEEIWKTSVIWSAIWLPGTGSDNMHSEEQQKALSWCEAALKAFNLKACRMKNSVEFG